MAIRCEEAGIALLELIDGELPSEQRVEVLGHLGACKDCAAEFFASRAAVALMQTDLVPEPPPRFWEEFLPSIKRRIERETFRPRQRAASRWAGLRSWFAFPRPLIAGAAVAAISVLIVVRLQGIPPIGADRLILPPSIGQFAVRGGDVGDWPGLPRNGNGTGEVEEPYILAGEVVDDPSALAAAIQRLPWVGEVAEQAEAAWFMRTESDPKDWLSLLSEDEQQTLVNHLREFQWLLS